MGMLCSASAFNQGLGSLCRQQGQQSPSVTLSLSLPPSVLSPPLLLSPRVCPPTDGAWGLPVPPKDMVFDLRCHLLTVDTKLLVVI